MSNGDWPERSRCVVLRQPVVSFALLLTLLVLDSGRLPLLEARQLDIGYEPTPLPVVEKMLGLARVGPNDVVYDLGSGDGRIPIMAAQKYGARAVGVELQPGLVHQSRLAAEKAGVASRVRFVQANFFEVDLSEASVVTMYLWPAVNDRLEVKLRRELRPGSRIVSYGFPMGKWVAAATAPLENGRDLFLWTVPRRPVREPDVPFVPTPPAVVDEMLRLAEVKPTDTVFDLGSGDGRIVIMAAQTHGSRGVGVEIDPELVDTSRQVAEQGQLADRVTFVEGDIFDADLSKASVVFLSLSSAVNARLEAKLRALRRGTRIVSRRFPIGAWRPGKVLRAADGSDLYLWVVDSP